MLQFQGAECGSQAGNGPVPVVAIGAAQLTEPGKLALADQGTQQLPNGGLVLAGQRRRDLVRAFGQVQQFRAEAIAQQAEGALRRGRTQQVDGHLYAWPAAAQFAQARQAEVAQPVAVLGAVIVGIPQAIAMHGQEGFAVLQQAVAPFGQPAMVWRGFVVHPALHGVQAYPLGHLRAASAVGHVACLVGGVAHHHRADFIVQVRWYEAAGRQQHLLLVVVHLTQQFIGLSVAVLPAALAVDAGFLVEQRLEVIVRLEQLVAFFGRQL